ncbi:MAG: SDR family oxidoreductase [Bacteroidota bacterium]
MKIFITGSNGLLGQKLVYLLKNNSEVQCIATARGENRILDKDGYHFETLDLTNKEEVARLLNLHKPDCIIHTAAMTNVDECELKPSECYLNNVEATKNLLEGCNQFQPHFIYVSTDFVFDGTAGPYTEEDSPNPLSVYANSKLAAEQLVQSSGLPYSILRTMIVYGITDDVQRSNIILWTKNSLMHEKDIRVINDQYRGPTLAEDLADACFQAAKRKATGIFHVSGREVISIIEIAYKVADYFGLDRKFIHPVSTTELNQPAKRPLKTGFIITKAERELGFNPRSIDEGIRIVDEQMNTK